MSRVLGCALALAVVAGAGCNKGGTYLLLRLDSDAPITVARFTIDLTHGAEHAHTSITPSSPVTLPPEQQVSLTLSDHPTGDIAVTVTADDGNGGSAVISGTAHIGGSGTTELPLTFTGGIVGGGANDLGSDDAFPPLDLTGSVPAASFTVTPSATSVLEHQQLTLHIQALNASGQPETGYQGTVTLSSSWGDVTPTAQPLFTNGVCDIAVSLDRETHTGFAGAVITATDGAATGHTAEITVTIGDWKVDGTAVRLKRTFSKSGMTLSENLHPGTVIAAPGGGYRLISDTTIHMGTPAANPAYFIWSSPDGMDWTGSGSYLALSDSAAGVSGTSIFWDGTMYHALYTGNDGTNNHLLGGSSSDGTNWVAETPAAPASPMCGSVQIGMLYGTGAYARIQGTGIYTCAVDVSGNYQYMMNVATTGQPWAGWAKEGTVWKIWAINGGQTYYYTSSDGINWIVSPTVWPAPVYAIYWNKERAQLEGFIDQDGNQSYYRAYRN